MLRHCNTTITTQLTHRRFTVYGGGGGELPPMIPPVVGKGMHLYPIGKSSGGGSATYGSTYDDGGGLAVHDIVGKQTPL